MRDARIGVEEGRVIILGAWILSSIACAALFSAVARREHRDDLSQRKSSRRAQRGTR